MLFQQYLYLTLLVITIKINYDVGKYNAQKLTKIQHVRTRWYDIYLFLIVSLKGNYRHYDTIDTYNWATKMLKEALNECKGGELLE
ncbi:hypothetical protein psyc5s11_41660 [Clostridium gelidum]|uniref:Uncharacterized protein n=1 Tax=Clostridium gelidum TaxID=704125 RepID=A0ABM7TAE9_9CLOT|nr:hypothetical protein [Clostridium gelidum]BCZ48099.1 hypothetical protein psyc5s11_41660 [Clostridium gelidum]